LPDNQGLFLGKAPYLEKEDDARMGPFYAFRVNWNTINLIYFFYYISLFDHK